MAPRSAALPRWPEGGRTRRARFPRALPRWERPAPPRRDRVQGASACAPRSSSFGVAPRPFLGDPGHPAGMGFVQDAAEFGIRRKRGRGGKGGERGILRLAEPCGIEHRVAAEHPYVLRVRLNLGRSEEHTSELQSREKLVCRLLLEKKKM